jgi:LAGLIDADG DNA endonuclease family protein
MKRWNDIEVGILKRDWFNSRKESLIESFSGRSWRCLERKAASLGLKRQRRLYSYEPQINKLPEWLQGELIGDGHIDPSGRYSHTTKYREYGDFLARKFAAMGLSTTVSDNSAFDKRTQKTYFRSLVRTKSVFKAARKKWYGPSKKTIPPNLEMSGEMLFHWIIGDGCVNTNMAFTLATCDFDIEDVEKLIVMLKMFGVSANRNKHGNIIHIRRIEQNRCKIKKLMREWVFPECYSYKKKKLLYWVSSKSPKQYS